MSIVEPVRKFLSTPVLLPAGNRPPPRGASLVELLVVVAIVAILVAAAAHYGLHTVARIRAALVFE